MASLRPALLTLAAALLALPSPALARQADANPPMEGFNEAGSDPKAIEIADAVMKAMGGRQAWDDTRVLSWTFGRDDQVWDKWTGDFRYQRGDLVVIMNINTRKGRAWENGTEITQPDSLANRLDRAFFGWTNSGYWLLMPYKLKDTGVTLKYLGEDTMQDGRPAEVLQLTFDNVGLTPQNKFLVYVDKQTMMVGQWTFYRNATDEEPSFTRPWRDWKRYGDIMLSDNRGEGSDGNDFVLPNVNVFEEVPPGVFTEPSRIDLSTLGR